MPLPGGPKADAAQTGLPAGQLQPMVSMLHEGVVLVQG